LRGGKRDGAEFDGGGHGRVRLCFNSVRGEGYLSRGGGDRRISGGPTAMLPGAAPDKDERTGSRELP
jgi:hypothetical protein